MADSRPQDSDFNFATMDWQAYIQFRPIYPAALYSTVFSYHDSHKGRYDRALDIGAGIGIVSKELLQKFKHVTISDPSENYLNQAKAMFKSVSDEKVAYLQTKAEELEAFGEYNLITAATCMHWADLELAMPRLAKALKPGGTFATWAYGVRPIFPDQSPSSDLFEAWKIFYEIYEKMKKQYETQIEAQQGPTSGAAQMNSRFDCMAFDPKEWKDVRRMHTRTDVSMVHENWPSAPSKVTGEEKVEHFEDQDLLREEAGFEYLEGYLINWIPPLNVPVLCKEELGRLKRAMGERKVEMTWPFVLVMATRR